MNRELLLAMAYSYLSYVFRDKRAENRVRRVILFGSVARNDFDEESDIDIFIDTQKEVESIVKKVVERALRRFYDIEEEKWALKGIRNRLSVKTGFLEEWELKFAIEKEGIALFSQAAGSQLTKKLLFHFGTIQSAKRRAKVMRRLYGRNEKGYKDAGIVQKNNGKILSPRAFIVPSACLKEVAGLLSREKIDFAFEEIWQ